MALPGDSSAEACPTPLKTVRACPAGVANRQPIFNGFLPSSPLSPPPLLRVFATRCTRS
jgi:hypothetical protein